MCDSQSTHGPSLDTRRGRHDAQWMATRRRRYRDGLLGSVIVGFTLVACGVLFLAAGVRELRDAATAGVVMVIAGCLMVALGGQIPIGTIKRRPLEGDSNPYNAAEAAERPYDQRLAQYLQEQPTPAVGGRGNSPTASRMAFFLAVLPGRRHGPKPPSLIREILLRIQQLLRGKT